MAATTEYTLDNRLAAIDRMVCALARNPGEWEPHHLRSLSKLESDIAAVRGAAINGLRDSGFTDRDIGAALGVSQQAVSKRWPGGARYIGAAGRYRNTQPQGAGRT